MVHANVKSKPIMLSIFNNLAMKKLVFGAVKESRPFGEEARLNLKQRAISTAGLSKCL